MPTGGGGGGGGGGLSTVTHDTTLTGSGTAGSPLAQVVTTFFSPFMFAGSSAAGFPFQTNQTSAQGLYIAAGSYGNISINVTTIDATNLYDLGFYTAAGVLVANIGAQTLPSGGFRTIAFSQGSVLFPAGLYFFAQTGNAAVAVIGILGNETTIYASTNSAGATSGGTLLPSITPLTKSVVSNGTTAWFTLD